MPLVQKTLTLAAGATSDNILANTNYEFVDGNVRLRVASAVDTAGINVFAMRYKALAVNGVLIAFAGAHLSTAVNANFFREMSAGRGYLALAAMIFGKWHPKTALIACLLFGFTDALQIRLQGVELPAIGEIPVQLIQAIPYILTVVLLAGFVGKAIAPNAIGQPYIKER